MQLSTTTQLNDVYEEELISVLTDAFRKVVRGVINEMEAAGILHDGNVQKVQAQGDKVVAVVTDIVKQKLAKLAADAADYLRPVLGAERLMLGITTGKRFIGGASEVFR